MNLPTNLDALSPDELRTLAAQLMAQVGEKDRELRYRQAKIDQLTHELAIHKRWKFGKRSEQLTSEQASLLDEAIDADLEAIETELEALLPSSKSEAKSKPKRQALPPQLPRTDIHHEPDAETCTCGCALKRIGEDISEKLDYTPGASICTGVSSACRTPWLRTSSCRASTSGCRRTPQMPTHAPSVDCGMARPARA